MAASATRSPMAPPCLLRSGFVVCLCVLSIARSAEAPSCPAGLIPSDSTPLAERTATQGCSPRTSHGGITHPRGNTGKNQLCELDHLVSLELGGADTVDNIWPQCGPNDVALAQRYFKIKDGVENYLAVQVRHGQMNLADAQRGIAHDWTRYADAARAYWRDRGTRGFGRDE